MQMAPYSEFRYRIFSRMPDIIRLRVARSTTSAIVER